MNQFFINEPFWEKEDVFLDTQENTDQAVERRWMETATFENQPYLKGEGIRTAADYPKWKSSDLLEDIMQCRKIVESQGHEFLVLDQTREEIGLNVVRVIVPGLRHFWSRFAPGRLYEVPVKMGKLDAPLNESELNPIHMFL
jgi:ribosomal protein S12 methylthiotransferase accessory factor